MLSVCLAGLPTPLDAVIVILKVWPASAAAGVPVTKARPPITPNRRPPGSLPDSFRVGCGSPVVVIVNEPCRPCLKVTLAAEVILGATPGASESVKITMTGELKVLVTLLFASMPNNFGEAVPLGSDPDSTPVLDRCRPLGSFRPLKVGAGVPVALIWIEFWTPTANVADVVRTTGSVPTLIVSAWCAGRPIP